MGPLKMDMKGSNHYLKSEFFSKGAVLTNLGQPNSFGISGGMGRLVYACAEVGKK